MDESRVVEVTADVIKRGWRPRRRLEQRGYVADLKGYLEELVGDKKRRGRIRKSRGLDFEGVSTTGARPCDLVLRVAWEDFIGRHVHRVCIIVVKDLDEATKVTRATSRVRRALEVFGGVVVLVVGTRSRREYIQDLREKARAMEGFFERVEVVQVAPSSSRGRGA